MRSSPARGAARFLLPIALTGVCLVTGHQVALAATCYQQTYQCNLSAQADPAVTWPQGVSGTFPTVDGAFATVIVNSVEVNAGNLTGDQAEVGWRLYAGANRFEPFAVSVFNGVYLAYPAARPAGNFTFTYTVRYRPSTQCIDVVPCFEATAVSGGTTYLDAQWTARLFQRAAR